MWWLVKKSYEDTGKVVYSYSRESNALDGEIECFKNSEEFKCLKLSNGDCIKSVENFYSHLWRIIFKENCPEERIIATG